MGRKIAAGIAILVAIGAMLYFTNIFELASPTVDKTINSTENVASNVTINGKDVVSKIKTVSSDMQNVISQIKIKNPYP